MDKRYKCYECGEPSSAYAWNQETAIYLGEPIFSIDSKGNEHDTFVCPECGEEQPRHVIGEVSHD